jgi:hypothetical protein
VCFFLSDITSSISDLKFEIFNLKLSDVTSDNSHYSIVKDQLNYFRRSVETSALNLIGIGCSLGTTSCRIERSSSNAVLNSLSSTTETGLVVGGGEGSRTPDPMVANHVLCQLSYTPETIDDCQLTIADWLKCKLDNSNRHLAIGNRQCLSLVAGAGFEPATFGL